MRPSSSSESLSPELSSADGTVKLTKSGSARLKGIQPRRTLSLIPLKAIPEATDSRKLQLEDLGRDWHIAWNKLKKLDELGKGSFKVVYSGTYLDTPVAIGEVIGVDKTDFVALENELKILQHIRHPNTLLFIGVSFGDGDKFYIVTEFAPLGDLRDLLKERGALLSWKCKIKMAEEIGHALAYLHDRGVFHRDLKCENVLVFPGNNDGLLLKVADFGLGFLNDKRQQQNADDNTPVLPRIPGLDDNTNLRLPHIPTRSSVLTSSQVGTVWIRAPEVDSQQKYSASAVDCFSFGLVLVDILTDGNGEEIRWEVTYQKRDPSTGKTLLSFGFDTKKLHDTLSRYKTRMPVGLVQLAVQCCDEEPSQRPPLTAVNGTLAQLSAKYAQTERLREHLAQQLQQREAQALAASAAIRSDEGTQVWAGVTHGLTNNDVSALEAWEACLTLFETLGPPLLEEESAVLCEAVGAVQEGLIDATLFGAYWIRLEPTLNNLKDEQLGWLWRNGLVALFVDRAHACAMLARCGGDSVVFRVSSTVPGKLTVSVLRENKAVHQVVSVDENSVVLGSGKDAKSFDSISELFLFLDSIGYHQMVKRNGIATSPMAEIAGLLPPRVRKASVDTSMDGYIQAL